jgi:hypothetical protein
MTYIDSKMLNSHSNVSPSIYFKVDKFFLVNKAMDK